MMEFDYENLGHLAFILVGISFMVRSMLWLRIISILAASVAMSFNYLAPAQPLWVAVKWNFFFAMINLFHVGLLLYERRKVRFSDREQKLYDKVFQSFTPQGLREVYKHGYCRTVSAGAVLVNQKQRVDAVMVLVSGSAEVLINKKRVAVLKAGDFIGEMSFITNDLATATVKTIEETEYYIWDQKELKILLQNRPELIFPMQETMGCQLKEKLMGSTKKLSKKSSKAA